MGNVSGRQDEPGSSGAKNEAEEEDEEAFMEYGAHVSRYPTHGQFPDSMVQSPPHSPRASSYLSPVMFASQVPIVPLGRPEHMIQTQRSQKRIPTIITWNYEGNQVAIEGSWDNWKTRELLERSGNGFSIVKVLPLDVYHFQFVVDGQWRYSPDLPHQRDHMGNVFNILDLQDHVPEVLNDPSPHESPPSPISSYDNAPFTSEELSLKLPELPPLLQKSPLDHPPFLNQNKENLEKPLPAVLNHLYVQKGRSGQSTVALSSTHRFKAKHVTVVLYKSLSKLKK